MVMTMKISKCKKELARIISEHGGWRNGEFAAQDGDDCAVWFYDNAPVRSSGAWWVTSGSGLGHCGIEDVAKLPNWHQTILSRDEYFHLYPAPDAQPEFCESVMRTTPEPEAKPTIDQLLQDWRNADDFAKRKQAEADEAAAMRDERWSAVQVKAGEIGVTIGACDSVASEHKLEITDWRDLQLNDIIEYVDGSIKDKIGMTGHVVEFAPNDTDGMMVRMKCDNGPRKGRLGWPMKWRFIRRP